MSKPSADDRSSSCTFIFSDGRRCRSLRSPISSLYCLFHERKQQRLREAECTAVNISEPLSSSFISNTSLNTALIRLFTSIADGRIPSKTAAQLISLSKLLIKTISLSKSEFLLAFNNNRPIQRLIRQMYLQDKSSGVSHDDNLSPSDSSEASTLPEDPAEFVKSVLSTL